MIGRVAAISVAVLVCAWFALGTRQAQDLSRAAEIVVDSGSISASQATRADALLSSAALLNPDRQIDILRGNVALDRHQRPRAIRIFEQVTREEPMNVNAWVYLARAELGNDAQVKRAVAHIEILDPGPGRRH